MYFILNHDTEILYIKSYKNIAEEKSVKGIFSDLQNKITKSLEESITNKDLVFEMQYYNDNIKIYFEKLSLKNSKYTLENGNSYYHINTKWFVLTSWIKQKFK